MRKRLRKKLRVVEFRELGFELRFQLDPRLSEGQLDHFTDAFLAQGIEGNNLMCGGGCGREWEVFVTRTGRGSVTAEQLAAVRAWLARRPEVREVSVGQFEDAWH